MRWDKCHPCVPAFDLIVSKSPYNSHTNALWSMFHVLFADFITALAALLPIHNTTTDISVLEILAAKKD